MGFHYHKHIIIKKSELGDTKRKDYSLMVQRCKTANLSHQGYIVETQQSFAVTENELGWLWSQSGKSDRLGISDIL